MKAIIYIIIGVIIGIVISNTKNKSEINIEKILSRQAARWSVAAEQDGSPIVKLLHANYGAGYLWALRDISTDNEIKKKTGIDILEFQKKIVDIQDKSTKAVTKACPQFVGDVDKYLLRIGGDA